MRCFHWLAGRSIFGDVDLRISGWRMQSDSINSLEAIRDLTPDTPILIDHETVDAGVWRWLNGPRGVRLRRWALVVGMSDGQERARLLRRGFGDICDLGIGLPELHARALRITQQAEALVRWRQHGPLRLDLIERDAFVGDKSVGLHPREFAVLWRLMDSPGETVGKRELLRDVWNLSFVPETNSVAVHTSRLRSKLALAGLPGWIQTAPGGGYQLVGSSDEEQKISDNIQIGVSLA
ncbi:DNA-binding response OmpR family regulator [Novosphingobium sp. SG707]|nr:DNA-binding response OmpR family regulator [Novosphingobium sp. SG707]